MKFPASLIEGILTKGKDWYVDKYHYLVLSWRKRYLSFDNYVKRFIQLMSSIKNILNRIKAVEGVDSDYKVSQILNVTPSYISTWRKRGTIPYKELHKYCQTKGISFDWLLTGDGEMLLGHSTGAVLDEEAAQLRIELTAEAAKVDPKNYTVAKLMLKGLRLE